MAIHKDHGKKPAKAPPGHHMMPSGKPMADKDMNSQSRPGDKEHKGKMPMKGKGHG